jgi:hypothetical protein
MPCVGLGLSGRDVLTFVVTMVVLLVLSGLVLLAVARGEGKYFG